MRTKIFTIIFVAFAAMASVSAQSSKIVKQNRDVASFSAINASGGWDVIIRQGNRQSVSIEVSDNILDRAVVEVKNGTLHIYNKSVKNLFSMRNLRNVTQKAYVTVTDLESIKASGGVDIEFETPLKTNDFELVMSGGTDLEKLSLNCTNFKGSFSGGCDAEITFSGTQNIKIDASGGSDVTLRNIASELCRVSASGGCDVKLTGKTNEFSVTASGGCDVSATDLQAKECTAVFSGAADGEIRVSNSLNATVSGSSDLTCYGNPEQVTKTVSRGSSLTIR